MTADDLRAAMRKRFTGVTMNEWCRLAGVHKGHLSEFLNGKRGPCSDLLEALNMRVDYVKVKRPPQVPQRRRGSMKELLPCPFCGGEAATSTTETESLFSHATVTYTSVGCDECDMHFSSEPGFEVEAPEQWNTRTALASSAPATGEREQIVGWLEDWIAQTLGQDISPQYLIEVLKRGDHLPKPGRDGSAE